jgi:hypothetical protein
VALKALARAPTRELTGIHSGASRTDAAVTGAGLLPPI